MLGRRQRAQRFDALMRPHVMAMYQQALRLLGDPHDAEDLVQDVLTKLYRRLSKLEQVADLRPWLLRVIYNAHIDMFRHRSRSPQSAEDDLALQNVSGRVELEPDAVRQRAELGEQLAQAVALLPPEQRVVVELHLVEGYTLQELARTLGLPVGTLKARVHRAKGRLRDTLDDATLSSI